MNYTRTAGMWLMLLQGSYSGAQPCKVYIAPDDHTDYMWSGNEEQYSKAFTEMLDYYIRLNDSTSGAPYPLQSKWNCDGSYWVYAYQQQRSDERFDKLISQIRSGKITVPLNTLVGVNGVAPLEATLRSMYYAGYLEKKYSLELDLAMNMEDQVMPLGLASLWAGSGAKYSWHGVCNCATKVKGLTSRPHELYWYTGLDGQRVLMKWYSLSKSLDNRELGGYAEAFDPKKSITLCRELMKSDRYPYTIAGAFGMGWDNLATTTGSFLQVAREQSNSDCQVIVSNEIDFFRDVENNYGEVLPSETVSYGTSEWGINLASLAAVSAEFKRSVEKLRTAEALSTMVSLRDPDFCSDLETEKEQAWIACGLYYDHDWTADGSVISRHDRASWQRTIAANLRAYVDTLYGRSLKYLGDCITKNSKKNEEFFVFNPLGWNRTDYCDYPYAGSKNILVRDETTGRTVPFQVISKSGSQWIRILVCDLPPVGYKVYAIIPGSQGHNPKQDITIHGNTIENDFYRVTLDNRGALVSLTDKLNGNRELVKPTSGVYLNDLGGKGDVQGTFRDENVGPVTATLMVYSDSPVRHETRITLYRDINRIGIENSILQNITQTLCYGWNFDMDKPVTWHEEAGAILLAKSVSQGGHYSEIAARLDWLGLNHFASVSDNTSGIILSNRDACFMKTGNSRVDSLDGSSPRISILAGGQIDADINLGIPAQDGDAYFENFFALRSFQGKPDAAQSMRFSLEHQNPPVAGKVSGGSGYPAKTFSLVQISDPALVLWALKPAEEGIVEGIIARVWNLEDENRTCELSFPWPVLSAKTVTHIEKDTGPLYSEGGKIITDIGHNQIRSYRIFLDNQYISCRKTPGGRQIRGILKFQNTCLNY